MSAISISSISVLRFIKVWENAGQVHVNAYKSVCPYSLTVCEMAGNNVLKALIGDLILAGRKVASVI